MPDDCCLSALSAVVAAVGRSPVIVPVMFLIVVLLSSTSSYALSAKPPTPRLGPDHADCMLPQADARRHLAAVDGMDPIPRLLHNSLLPALWTTPHGAMRESLGRAVGYKLRGGVRQGQ